MTVIPLHKHRFVGNITGYLKVSDNNWILYLTINQEEYTMFISDVREVENGQISFQTEYGIYHYFDTKKVCKHCDQTEQHDICHYLSQKQYDVINRLENLREVLEKITLKKKN